MGKPFSSLICLPTLSSKHTEKIESSGHGSADHFHPTSEGTSVGAGGGGVLALPAAPPPAVVGRTTRVDRFETGLFRLFGRKRNTCMC